MFIILINRANQISAIVSLITLYILMNIFMVFPHENILISLSILVFSCYHNKLNDLKQQKCILSSGGQKPKASMLEGPHSLEALGEHLSFASFSLWWLLAFLDLWLHRHNLPLSQCFHLCLKSLIAFLL